MTSRQLRRKAERDESSRRHRTIAYPDGTEIVGPFTDNEARQLSATDPDEAALEALGVISPFRNHQPNQQGEKP